MEEMEEKEEKEDKEEEEKFLQTGGPTKGSTRGPRGPKKDSEDVSANFSISACNDGTCIPIEERFCFYKTELGRKNISACNYS